MATTYSNPKEMLGYIVVKFIDNQLPLLQTIPYDKRACFSFYWQLKGLDAQLVSFREDMSISFPPDEGEEDWITQSYYEIMPEINKIVREKWNHVMAREYEDFMGALYKWAELIASCYPKLGLVPESDTFIEDQRENMVEPNEEEMEKKSFIGEEDNDERQSDSEEQDIVSKPESREDSEPIDIAERIRLIAKQNQQRRIESVDEPVVEPRQPEPKPVPSTPSNVKPDDKRTIAYRLK